MRVKSYAKKLGLNQARIKSSKMAQRGRCGEIAANMWRNQPYAKQGGARDWAVAQIKSGAGEV
jgi:hypothetical protein